MRSRLEESGACWPSSSPAVSIAIGLVIAWRAVKLVGETTSLLLESTPEGIDVDEVTRTVRSVPGVEAVHDPTFGAGPARSQCRPV